MMNLNKAVWDQFVNIVRNFPDAFIACNFGMKDDMPLDTF